MRRLLDDDPITGTRQWFVPSDDGRTFQIVTEQVVTPILADNAERRKTRERWGDGQLVARIPNVVMDDLIHKGIAQDNSAFRRWLNDPTNKVFRLREGKV
jgi:hypothetical protein